MIKAAPPSHSVMNTTSFMLIVTAAAICAVYLAFSFFKESQQLARDLRRFQRQAESLLLEKRKLTAPEPAPPPPPRKTQEQWKAEHAVQQAERQKKAAARCPAGGRHFHHPKDHVRR
jgi:hypothetical protein